MLEVQAEVPVAVLAAAAEAQVAVLASVLEPGCSPGVEEVLAPEALAAAQALVPEVLAAVLAEAQEQAAAQAGAWAWVQPPGLAAGRRPGEAVAQPGVVVAQVA